MSEQNSSTENKKKKPSTLEGILNTTIGAAAIGASTAAFGTDALVTSAAFPAGGFLESRLAGKDFKTKNFRDEAITGALFSIPLVYGVNAMRQLPKTYGLDSMVNVLGYSLPASALAVGALSFASIPLFNAVYYPIKYIIDNKSFNGLAKDFKENYWKGTIRGLYLGVPWAATIAASVALPALSPYLFPILAGFEVAYRVILSKEKLKYLKMLNPLTYIPDFLKPNTWFRSKTPEPAYVH